MRESRVERGYVEAAAGEGSTAYKFVSPGRRGVPDRLKLKPIPEEHRAIVARYVRFAELKAPGKKPTPQQVREHTRLRRMGYVVDVIDSLEGIAELFTKEL